MFEDIDNEAKKVAITRDAADRVIVYAIWTRDAQGVLPVDEAWSVLASRYPDDPRLLLVNTFEELGSGHAPGAWTPRTFLDKVRTVLDNAGGKLNPEARDLLAVAEDNLHPLSPDDAARLDRIRARVGARIVGDAGAARKRLTRFASDLVRELHDRTQGGAPIGKRGAAASSANEWKSAVASAKGAKRAYAADAKVAAGDLVEHPKFGVGVVTAVEPGRAHILFESGSRRLVVG